MGKYLLAHITKLDLLHFTVLQSMETLSEYLFLNILRVNLSLILEELRT